MLVIMIIIVYATAVDCSSKNKVERSAGHAQKPFLETLRRQLMENNYDYHSMEEPNHGNNIPPAEYPQHSPEERLPVEEGSGGDKQGEKAGEDEVWRGNEINEENYKLPQANSHEFKVHDRVVGLDVLSLQNYKKPHFRSYTSDPRGGNRKPSHVVSKTDLLYYVDENRFRRSQDPRYDVDPLKRNKDEDFDDMYPRDDDVVTTPKVKYKLIKVRERSPTRRNAPPRRFLLEQGSEGVSFMSLDAAPFPEFKLPRSRRQYMRDAGEELKGTDMEVELKGSDLENESSMTNADPQQINHYNI